MFLIKLIILIIVFYIAAKVFALLFQQRSSETRIKGKPHSPSLDLTKEDVEDVDYEETKQTK
ncbi:hypothetical protein JXO59_03435 [candidate division KSB1 bacterium]|nr:hypothetical protein [candidate division KSB1 bacterium]